MARTVVELRGLGKSYGPVVAVDGMDLTVFEGEFLSLLGPSGCGKTTTLNLIAGFIEPTRGRVLIDGEEVTGVPAYRRGLGVVFQNYALFPHMTVFENIAFGLRMRGAGRAERERRVGEALTLVRLEGHARARPAQLSGGMQQRVALARALAYQPQILLMDEPFASVDAQTRSDLEDLLLALWQKFSITILFVTHDIEEAIYLADRVLVLSPSPARVIGEFPVELPRPRDQIRTRSSSRFMELREALYHAIKGKPQGGPE